ncbi:hypothetical protein BC332_14775 [Capsicum chinense]|nr:hypothetical protein BC332_14775 [Capsicum chinense]
MENEGERKNNFVVSFSALCKDVVNVLDFMERLKNEEDQNAVDIADQIEELKSVLAFICTYIQLSSSDLEEFEDIMSAARQWVENLLRPILDDVDSNVGCKYTMDHNLHHRCKYRAEQIFPLETQDEILQNVSVNMKDFHGLIVNGCIEHGIVQYVLPQFQLMAERVGIFLWHDRLDRGYFQKSPQLEDSAMEIKQCVEDMTGEDKLQILGPNNIPLSKTGSHLLFCCLEPKFTRVVYNMFDEFSIELFVKFKTLPCFPELFRHAQFTPPSWRAAAMPRTVSLLLQNASDFNCPAWLSASFTDEHASPVPLSRILKASIVFSHNLMPFESFWGHGGSRLNRPSLFFSDFGF